LSIEKYGAIASSFTRGGCRKDSGNFYLEFCREIEYNKIKVIILFPKGWFDLFSFLSRRSYSFA